jgi:hypothetical protein
MVPSGNMGVLQKGTPIFYGARDMKMHSRQGKSRECLECMWFPDDFSDLLELFSLFKKIRPVEMYNWINVFLKIVRTCF